MILLNGLFPLLEENQLEFSILDGLYRLKWAKKIINQTPGVPPSPSHITIRGRNKIYQLIRAYGLAYTYHTFFKVEKA